MKWNLLLLIAVFFSGYSLMAQGDEAKDNWFDLDPAKDGVQGVSTERMYQELLAGKKSKTVIVRHDQLADSEHEDLKSVMWVNEDEIPGNGKDDDNNGYVDDVHGWNFIGGADGKNVNQDTYEITRLYVKYKKYFEGKDLEKLSKKDKALHEEYQAIKTEIEEKQQELEGNVSLYQGLLDGVRALKAAFGKDEITKEELESFQPKTPL